jgi:hypothetical protein
MVMDGLLQTEEYARGLLSVRPNTTSYELDELVTARIDRQVVLDRTVPPLLWVVMDEAVLHRQVNSAKVMHEQLVHLADMSERPNITVELVPASAGAHTGLLGAFAIVEADETARVGYLETATDGLIVESNSVVAGLMVTFDTLRSEALTRGASRELILREATKWT